jgi:hypothetical protein
MTEPEYIVYRDLSLALEMSSGERGDGIIVGLIRTAAAGYNEE